MSAQGSGAFERTLETEGVLFHRIEGVSMQPLLRQKRDAVVVRPKQGRLQKYDVALYRRESGKYVLHRVVRVLNDGYVIRGDNCYFDETDITDREIIGVMTDFVRKGRQRSSSSAAYRLYARLWVGSYALRRFLHLCKGFLTEGLWVHLSNRKQ
jgi:signal peptidase I